MHSPPRTPSPKQLTLKTSTRIHTYCFIGTNFRDSTNFFDVHESVYPRKKVYPNESFYSQKFATIKYATQLCNYFLLTNTLRHIWKEVLDIWRVVWESRSKRWGWHTDARLTRYKGHYYLHESWSLTDGCRKVLPKTDRWSISLACLPGMFFLATPECKWQMYDSPL